MSLTTLANLLDQGEEAGAFVDEGARNIVASNLAAIATKELAAAATAAGVTYEIFDQADNAWQSDDLDARFEPFRVALQKPELPPGVLGILTKRGFRVWLKREDVPDRWAVVGLKQPIETLGVLIAPWGDPPEFKPAVATKSPRSLVREYTAKRRVPADIRRWILSDPSADIPNDPFFNLWADLAVREILLSLPDELDSEDRVLKFRGPPRLSLKPPPAGTNCLTALSGPMFTELQRAVAWVFDNEREAELRHGLLSAEIARSGGGSDQALDVIRRNIHASHEGAKIAYQMSLSELSADTLKALGELRKAVTDETSKVTDATRAIIAAVATALAVGIGLIAVRLFSNADKTIVLTILVVVIAYVALVITSGIQFVLLQRRLRQQWQPRLYRFLPNAEYKAMVSDPARRSELAMWTAAGIGAIAILALALAVFRVNQLPRDEQSNAVSTVSENLNEEPDVKAPVLNEGVVPAPAGANSALEPDTATNKSG